MQMSGSTVGEWAQLSRDGLSSKGWSIPALRDGQIHPKLSPGLGRGGLVRLLSPRGPVPAAFCLGDGELWWVPRRGAAHLNSLSAFFAGFGAEQGRCPGWTGEGGVGF